jgi:hypothetical protein
MINKKLILSICMVFFIVVPIICAQQVSTIQNPSSTAVDGYLTIKIQKKVGYEDPYEKIFVWTDEITLVDKSQITIEAGNELDLNRIWNNVGGYTATMPGTYRVYVEFDDVNESYEFSVVPPKIIERNCTENYTVDWHVEECSEANCNNNTLVRCDTKERGGCTRITYYQETCQKETPLGQCHIDDSKYCQDGNWVNCTENEYCAEGTCIPVSVCGNEICEQGENYTNCPSDCVIDCLADSSPGSGKSAHLLSLDDPIIYQTAEQALQEYADYKGIDVSELKTSDDYIEAVALYVHNHMWYDCRGDCGTIQEPANEIIINSAGKGCGGDYCGDCQEFSILRAALLRALGVNWRCVFSVEGEHTHVYNIVLYKGAYRIMDWGPLGEYFHSCTYSFHPGMDHTTSNIWNDHVGEFGTRMIHPSAYTYNYPNGIGCPEGGWTDHTYYTDICPGTGLEPKKMEECAPYTPPVTKIETICGNNICEFGETRDCPEDCEGIGIANVHLIDPITTPEPTQVHLTDLDGSGYLKGRYVDVVNALPPFVAKGDPKIPTPRVNKNDLNFVYEPVNFTLSLSAGGQLGYWGYDDVTDSGHRFDQASIYYYTNEAAKYFVERFGFQPKRAVQVRLYDTEYPVGFYDNDYHITHTMLEIDGKNSYRQVRGHVHEYTHLVQNDLSTLPYDSDDEQGLVESFPKYFESAFTNIPYDPYIYNLETGIKNFSDYDRWKNERGIGKGIGFVLASAWWHLREELGAEITDNLVYESMKHVGTHTAGGIIVSSTCAADNALKATLKADEILYNKAHENIIIGIFDQHNIQIDECFTQ